MANKISIKDFKSNNYLITVLIVVLFFGLIFLPEMLGLGINPAENIKEGLNFDFSKVWGKDKNNIQEEEQVEEYVYQEVSPDNLLVTNTAPIRKNTNISWTLIKSSKTKNDLRAVKGRAISFANSLDERLIGSRYKLFDYASGIEFILNRGQEVMTAEEAYDYILRLDSKVTESFNKENASRDILIKWSNISRISSFENVSIRKAVKVVPKFEPMIYFKEIKFVRVLTDRNNFRIRSGEFVLWPTIYYKGNDVNKFVEVYHNGEKIKTAIGKKVGDEKNDWYVLKAPRVENGVLTFLFHSKDGKKYAANYKFYGKLPQFKWKKSERYKVVNATYRFSEVGQAKALEKSLRYIAPNQKSTYGNLISVSNTYGNLIDSNISYATF